MSILDDRKGDTKKCVSTIESSQDPVVAKDAAPQNVEAGAELYVSQHVRVAPHVEDLREESTHKHTM